MTTHITDTYYPTQYVLLSHCVEYSASDYNEHDPEEAYYTYELIVPPLLVEDVETALAYGNVNYTWNCEYNDCQHYFLDETDADNKEWQKVTNRLSMIMAEFCIDYGHDPICYHM
jgi:hypothetical protein